MAEGAPDAASCAPPAGAAMAAAPEDDDPVARVLRRGDLVKVLER